MTHTALNAFSRVTENRPKRFTDDNGFLHIFLRVMRTGTLEYDPETYGDDIPDNAVGKNGRVTVYVPEDELSDPASLASLKGLPCLREHKMIVPEDKKDITGAVAGDPEYAEENGTGYVECEAVITDARTISELQNGDLTEVSAAYRHDIDWTPGRDGETPYSGIQKNIRYNHFVLLPQGEGRAGPTVAVVNAKDKENDDMTKNTVSVWLPRLKRAVTVMNKDDADAVEEEINIPKEEVAPPPEGDAHTDVMPDYPDDDAEAAPEEEDVPVKNAGEQVDEQFGIIEKLQAKINELQGQLEEAKAKIKDLADPAKQEAAVEAVANEREEAADVMAAEGIDKKEAMNSIKARRFVGHDLRCFALNGIRSKQGRPALTIEQVNNRDLVLGMWEMAKENAGRYNAPKPAVAGAFSAQNSTVGNTAKVDYRDPAVREAAFLARFKK